MSDRVLGLIFLSADWRDVFCQPFAFITNNKSKSSECGQKGVDMPSIWRDCFENKIVKKKSLPVVSLPKLLSPVFNTAGIWSHEQSDYTNWAM